MHSRILMPLRPMAAERPVITLPDVTLVAVTSVALPQTVRAMMRSLEQVDFASALFISDRPPPGTPDGITWRRIEPIVSHACYSRFMLRDLVHHVTTSHVLCIQWDGYILDARRWDPGFLDYDYVGAPWPQFADRHNVGNGGFSLRSHRLLQACAGLEISGMPEDVAICRLHRTAMEREFGISFAPEDVARRFAFERYAAQGDEFGFHGVFNLAKLTGDQEFSDLVGNLESTVLNRREHRELLGIALRRGQPGLALTILRRIRRGAGRR